RISLLKIKVHKDLKAENAFSVKYKKAFSVKAKNAFSSTEITETTQKNASPDLIEPISFLKLDIP
ncbi:MAG: hypothetical protein RJA83_402, partial [Pseudomonadota bacterium]